MLFYANLVALQQSVIDTYRHAVRTSAAFAEALDFESAADAMPSLLSGLLRIAPPPVVAAATHILEAGHAEWRHLVHTYWDGARDGDPLRAFLAEALLQPFAEFVSTSVRVTHQAPDEDIARVCPVCGDRPVVAVLHEAAHSTRRSLVCGFCAKEWAAPRIACVACGEREFDKLAIYHAEELPGTRVDVCETCHTYVKTIDLAKDGTAIPIVDDLATLALDLWARERGYQRIRANLLRL